MSAAARHPLAALAALRRRLLDEARSELARAAAEAQHARCGAQEAGRALEAAIGRRRAAERSAPGARSAAECEGSARWLGRLRGEERALAGEAEARRDEAARCVAAEELRRCALVEAERRLRAVELHRERWEAERRRAARQAEEAEQEDRAAARAGQRPT